MELQEKTVKMELQVEMAQMVHLELMVLMVIMEHQV